MTWTNEIEHRSPYPYEKDELMQNIAKLINECRVIGNSDTYYSATYEYGHIDVNEYKDGGYTVYSYVLKVDR